MIRKKSGGLEEGISKTRNTFNSTTYTSQYIIVFLRLGGPPFDYVLRNAMFCNKSTSVFDFDDFPVGAMGSSLEIS